MSSRLRLKNTTIAPLQRCKSFPEWVAWYASKQSDGSDHAGILANSEHPLLQSLLVYKRFYLAVTFFLTLIVSVSCNNNIIFRMEIRQTQVWP